MLMREHSRSVNYKDYKYKDKVVFFKYNYIVLFQMILEYKGKISVNNGYYKY